jgi:hypothetical protein
MSKQRHYREFDPANGYPAATNLFYECLICGEVVPSLPNDSVACNCKNIMVDIDYGRLSIQDASKSRLFSEAPRRRSRLDWLWRWLA